MLVYCTVHCHPSPPHIPAYPVIPALYCDCNFTPFGQHMGAAIIGPENVVMLGVLLPDELRAKLIICLVAVTEIDYSVGFSRIFYIL